MDKIDWKRKLTSRKFWVAFAGFVGMLFVAFGGTESESAQITALIMSGATAMSYIVGEGLTDVANAKKEISDGILFEAKEGFVSKSEEEG